MKEIFVSAIPNPKNLGSLAVVMCAEPMIRNAMPDAKLTYLATYHLQEDARDTYNKCNIKLSDYILYKRGQSKPETLIQSGSRIVSGLLDVLTYRSTRFIGLTHKTIFSKCDAIVDLSTDSLNDLYGPGMPIFSLFNLWLFLATGKPVILCASSVGPFKSNYLKLFAKYVLNKVSTITLREDISSKYLSDMGVNKPKIQVTADLAFLLRPAPPQRINEILSSEGINQEERPIIAISPSQLIHKYAFPEIESGKIKYKTYVEIMAETIDYIADQLNATIILIPHAIVSTADNSQDDRIISREIKEKVKAKDRVKILKGDYLPDELKGIISLSDMFIGFRMHPTIAATSMGIPTIAVAYGTKFHGIIGRLMGQEENMIGIEGPTSTELKEWMVSRIDHVWANRQLISKNLKEKARIARDLSLENGVIIRKFIS